MTMLDAIGNKPLKVTKVIVLGLEKTKEHVVFREVEHLTEGRTFNDVKELVEETYAHIDQLSIFDKISIEVDASDEGQEDCCQVIVKVVERGLLGLKMGTYIQGSRGSLEGTVSLKNYFGYAENFQLTIDGFKEKYELNDFKFTSLPGGLSLDLQMSIPRPYGKDTVFEADIHHNQRNLEKWSSYAEQRSGLGIANTWATLNDASFPTSGFAIRSSTELAGIWPDPKALRYSKHEVHAQWVRPLGNDDVVLAVQGNAGLMLPWGRDYWNRVTNVSERFDAGGLTNGLRGFQYKGIGDTASRLATQGSAAQDLDGEDNRSFDYLGGDLQADVSAAIRIRNLGIDVLDANGIYVQAFVGCCNNQLLSGQKKTPKEVRDRFLDTFRISGGLSLVWPTSLAKFEIGYAHVRRQSTQPRDLWRNGIYFGCSANLW